MQRLQEECTDRPNEHRRIGVHTPDRILLAEPSFADAPDLSMLRLEVTGNPVAHSFRDDGARLWECPDHHKAERMRLWKRNRRSQPGGSNPRRGRGFWCGFAVGRYDNTHYHVAYMAHC